jgi:hypothetical protein
MQGCGNNQEKLTIKCYYPGFPNPNKNVLNTLKKTGNYNVELWLKKLIIYKGQIKILKGETNELNRR